jgi:hypothetical protein
MESKRNWTGTTLVLVSAAALALALPAGAQTQSTPPAKSTATQGATPSTAPAAPSTATPARKGDDDAAEFAKLDKNHDGALDKAEAMMEPRLLANFATADTNKDGKIDQTEFLNFYKNHPRTSSK